MKPSPFNRYLFLSLSAVTACAHADVLYWDINGTTAGAGGATPTGNWGDANWSTSGLGDVATTNWSSYNEAVFAAGTDATGAYEILGAGQAINVITVEDGANVTFKGATMAMGSPAKSNFVISGTASATVNNTLGYSNVANILWKSGTGTLNLTGGGSAQAMRVDGGMVNITGGSLSIVDGMTINSGALEIGGAGSLGAGNYAGTIADSGTLIFSTSANQTLSGVISGTGALTKSGGGNLTLTGANTYTGGTTVSAGALKLNLSARTGSYTLNSFSVGADGTLELSNTTTTTDNTLVQNTTFSGSGTINKTGAGYLTLHNGSSLAGFSGTINVSAGTLAVNNVGAGASTAGASVNIAGGATFDNRYNSNLVIDKLSGSGTLNHSFTDTVNVTVGANNGSSTFNGVITNAGGASSLALTKTGTGSQTLTGANTYTGKTTLSAGTLQFAKKASLYNGTTASWTAANITAASGATLALNVGGANGFAATDVDTLLTNISVASSATTGLQGGAGLGFDTSNSGGTFTQGNAIANSTGVNGGAIGVTKLGSGTLVLDKTNTYTGATTISGGTLKLGIGGSIANSSNIVVGDAGSSGAVLDATDLTGLTIGTGQTLKGIGTVNLGVGKTLTIAGTHAAGNSVGSQNIEGNLNYGNGSIFQWELNATNGADPGVIANSGAYDQVAVSGNLGGAGAVFNVALGTNIFSDAFWDTNKSWNNIFTAANSFNLASIFTSFSGAGVSTTGTVAGQGSFSFTANNTLTWSAVPEPSGALAGLLLGAGLMRRRRTAAA